MKAWKDIVTAVKSFQDETPSEAYQQQLRDLLSKAEAGDEQSREELADRFSGLLQFGTAGLRGEVGPGLARMNRVTVSKACFGLGRVLLNDSGSDKQVVIGFDARRMSRQFAEDSAEILSGMGIKVHIFDSIVPTPLLAYAVKSLSCDAGIMVTASHNPPLDNGYKVYWGNGAQIIPPIDGTIAKMIATAPSFSKMERLSRHSGERTGLVQVVKPQIESAYFDEVASRSTGRETARSALSIVYTAMHGTGHRPVMTALRRSGFVGVQAVAAQTEPDGAFPTVAFPNPEEDGALDLAIELAQRTKAHCILANDPDTDRLAAAVVNRTKDGWVRLTGNQVGALLGARLIEAHRNHKPTKKALVCTTLVSSSMLSRIAEKEGADFEETLTGFKWIANTGIDFEARGHHDFVFGYEEALGYACGPTTWDKDGVSATVRMAELLADLLDEKRTVWDRLDELSLRYGVSEDASWSVKCPGLDGRERLRRIMDYFRNEAPTELCGDSIVRTRDLELGTDNGQDDGRATVSKANVITYWTASGVRLTVRPSGTEPKVKFYLDCAGTAGSNVELANVRRGLLESIKKSRSEVESIVAKIK